MSWLKAINPASTITTEAEAERAARASAISIFIGVIVGVVGLAWTLANPAAMQEAVASAGGDPTTEAAAAMGAQAALWTTGALTVVQLILGIVQWRNPGKFIAILFMVLIAFGLLSNLATPMLAGAVPNMPEIQTWQIALSVVILIVQMALHVAGLRGIGKLDGLQMAAAR